MVSLDRYGGQKTIRIKPIYVSSDRRRRLTLRDSRSRIIQQIKGEVLAYQRLGASVAVHDETNTVGVCAPQYTKYAEAGYRGILLSAEPLGRCIYFDSNEDISSGRVSMQTYCGEDRDNEEWGYHFTGHCMAGTTLLFDSRNVSDEFGRSQPSAVPILGAPGSYYWQGELIRIDFQRPDDRAKYSTLTHTGNLNRTSLDDIYLGYSLAMGWFYGKKFYVSGRIGYGGMKEHIGDVVLVESTTMRFAELINPSRPTLFGQFGSSICVGDFNGDQLDDLAIGAPMTSDSPEGNFQRDYYDSGRVEVIYQKRGVKMSDAPRLILQGTKKFGRFGTTVQCVGDLNADNYDELAVSAPYDGHGKVHLFYGSFDGLNDQPLQVLDGQHMSLGQKRLTGFGFSISKAKPVTDPRYPTLAIGAVESDSVVIVRTRPVVRANIELGLVPTTLDLQKARCMSQTRRESCVKANLCSSIYDLNQDRKRLSQGSTEVTLQMTMDAGHEPSRAMEATTGNRQHNITLLFVNGAKRCISIEISIDGKLQDKLSPIKIQAQLLIENEYSFRNRGQLPPIIDKVTGDSAEQSIIIAKDCGPDEKCVPDLWVDGQLLETADNEFVLGQREDVKLLVTVGNVGDNAYNGRLEVVFPSVLRFDRIESTRRKQTVLPASCLPANYTGPERDKFSLVVCDVGNPLFSKQETQFKVILDPKNLTNSDLTKMTIKLNASSVNREVPATLADNLQTIDIPVRVRAKINLGGRSDPDQVIYNSSEVAVDVESGVNDVEIFHRYSIENNGPSDVSRISFNISWPSFYFDLDKPLMELIGSASISDADGYCLVRNFDEDRKRRSAEAEPMTDADSQLFSSDRRHNRGPTIVRCPSLNYCKQIQCTLLNMKSGQIAYVEVESMLVMETVLDEQLEDVKILSSARLQVESVPYKLALPAQLYTYEIGTIISPRDRAPTYQPLKLWIILLAVGIGLLILLLLVFVLWCFGFFRKHRLARHERKALLRARLERREEEDYF